MQNQNQKGNISIIVSIIITLCVIGFIIYALMHKMDTTQAVDTSATNPANNTTITEPVVTTIQTLQDKNKKTMEPIKNIEAKNGDTLVMNYTGRLTNGTVFDSNVDPKFHHVQPFEFTLGAHQVIAGWDEGLLGMKVGEKKTLTISPEKGYGAMGQGPIPPNSTLIFDVELVAIK